MILQNSSRMSKRLIRDQKWDSEILSLIAAMNIIGRFTKQDIRELSSGAQHKFRGRRT